MDPGQALVGLAGVLGVFGSPVAIIYMWTHRPPAKKEFPGRAADSMLEAPGA